MPVQIAAQFFQHGRRPRGVDYHRPRTIVVSQTHMDAVRARLCNSVVARERNATLSRDRTYVESRETFSLGFLYSKLFGVSLRFVVV